MACCRVSGLPVYFAPDWCWISPSGDYAIEIHRIGERIISLEHTGYVDSLVTRRGFALFERVLASMPAVNGSVMVLDDHSRISGATLNARRSIVKHLLRQSHLQAYIAYGASTVFHLSLNLARRMNLFNFKVRMAADYAQAMALAQGWPLSSARSRADSPTAIPADDDPIAAVNREARRERALQDFARELLGHIGQLNLEHNGAKAPPPVIAPDHPFRAVYDALELIHIDMQRILARHQRNLKHLQSQEQALLEKNAALAETHTTLKILLRTGLEERRKITMRIGQQFRDLLLPIVEALEATTSSGAQQPQAAFIRDIITHISQPFLLDAQRDVLKLTRRETLTAYLIARGCTSREAARVLNTSPRTIDRYRSGLRKKAGLQGTGQRLGGWIRRCTKTETLPGP
ncbi:MAG: hypothetical protein PVF55_07745 [Desulfobacterales bacterium]|jgi:DNA-binding NarL/FixJ family response regulator